MLIFISSVPHPQIKREKIGKFFDSQLTSKKAGAILAITQGTTVETVINFARADNKRDTSNAQRF